MESAFQAEFIKKKPENVIKKLFRAFFMFNLIKILIISSILLTNSHFLWTEQVNYDSAAVAAPWLNHQTGSRSSGRGQAGLTTADDIFMLNSNPAGLHGIKNLSAGFEHQSWAVDTFNYNRNQIMAGMPLNENNTLAAGFSYLDMGNITRMDVEDGQLVENGQISNYGAVFSIGAATALIRGIYAGIALKWVQEAIAGDSQAAVAADIGLQYTDSHHFLSLALTAHNLGQKLGGFNLPASIGAGSSVQFKTPYRQLQNLRLCLDTDIAVYDKENRRMNAGLEAGFNSPLVLRMGYTAAIGNTPASGFSAGFSFGIAKMELIYAYSQQNELGPSHNISVIRNF